MNITNVSSNPYRQYVSSYKARAGSGTEESCDDSSIEKIKDFACGILGIDQAENDSQKVDSNVDEKDGYYQMGQYIKAAGTVGSIIRFFV